MTVKKALIISTLAVILTGITACAVAYTKKTGENPFKTMETSASYDFTTYNYTNETYTINGTFNPTNNDDVGYIFQTVFNGTYTITRTTNDLTVVYNFTKMYSGHNGQIYTYNVNYTLTEVFTNQQIPENLNAIRLELAEMTRRYDAENQAYYYETSIYTALKGTTTTSRYKYWNIPEQQNVYMNESDYGYILDYVDIATTLATLHNTYQTGWTNGNQGQQDVVDIRGLMLNILTMPFTFISQAFNITMWEGTPYQINLSRLILSLIAIASILFIIKLFTSGFSVIGNYTGNKTNSRVDRQKKQSQTRLNNAKADKIEKGK